MRRSSAGRLDLSPRAMVTGKSTGVASIFEREQAWLSGRYHRI
jgi:hypothetical protein